MVGLGVGGLVLSGVLDGVCVSVGVEVFVGVEVGLGVGGLVLAGVLLGV